MHRQIINNMKLFVIILLFPLLSFVRLTASDGQQESDGAHKLIKMREYYWETFTLKKESPTSPDGDYQLKKVNRNGSVKLLFLVTPEEHETIIAKPAIKKTKNGMNVQTIIVVASNVKTQTATIKILKQREVFLSQEQIEEANRGKKQAEWVQVELNKCELDRLLREKK